MEEEFLESEIIFSEYPLHEKDDIQNEVDIRIQIIKDPAAPVKIPRKFNSFPVRIPETSVRQNCSWPTNFPAREDEIDGGGEIVPPHLIIGQRVVSSEKMAFSVCSGYGRTLKGRELRHVRNTILKMTGFLET
ncbi:uncharacterized protein LOC124935091 [Impatiens glandulifera]|uniref:uncharacterized protein LOC124935091 n=1 Tax=Impatiens glandulifera TaxID=253017 RepID=UPI001FB06639|nr:uncharacterized protein LOC124935091 [Impatiens glandulifera]